MEYVADCLGAGFEQAKIALEPDRVSSRSATLVRYTPGADPRAKIPDRVVPTNMRPGGGEIENAYTVLPPQASPQQPDEMAYLYRFFGAKQAYTPPRSLAQPLSASEQADASCLREYLDDELGGASLHTAAQLADPPQPCFILLYIHGWNDYFYQPHLARMLSHLGAAFYALDLHRYGRNLPDRWPGRLTYNGYTDDFENYDTEIDIAVKTVRQEHPHLPLIMMGHSNGGGVVAGWAARHHDDFEGIIYNSPWIVQDVSSIPGGVHTENLLADHGRGIRLPMPQTDLTTYADSLAGYQAIGSPLPRRLVPFVNDPSVKGWTSNPKWRLLSGAPVLIGWISAVLRNQHWLRDSGSFPQKPVLCLTGNYELDPSYAREVKQIDRLLAQKWRREGKTQLRRRLKALGLKARAAAVSRRHPAELGSPYRSALIGWTEASRHLDTVLNGKLIAQRVRDLYGSNLTMRTMSGYHDLTLSQPLERAAAFSEISAWLQTSGILKYN